MATTKKTNRNNQSKTNNKKQTTNNKKSEVMKKETTTTAKNEVANIETTILSTCNNAVEKYGKGTPEAAQYAADTLFNMGIIPTPKKRQKFDVNGKSVYLHQYFYKTGVYVKSDTPKRINAAARVCWSAKVAQMFDSMQKAAAAFGIDFAAAGINSVDQAAAALDSAAAKAAAAKVEAAAAKHTEKLNKAAARFSVADLEKMLEARKAAANA